MTYGNTINKTFYEKFKITQKQANLFLNDLQFLGKLCFNCVRQKVVKNNKISWASVTYLDKYSEEASKQILEKKKGKKKENDWTQLSKEKILVKKETLQEKDYIPAVGKLELRKKVLVKEFSKGLENSSCVESLDLKHEIENTIGKIKVLKNVPLFESNIVEFPKIELLLEG